MWLNMDRPNNLMVIDSIMWFDDPVDWDRLAEVVQHRLVDRYPVFRQRAVAASSPVGSPHWEDDPDFSLSRHLIRARLPEPGDEAALQANVETQAHLPFDRAHPLWEFHLIDGYAGLEPNRGGAAILTRFHHALADGVALSQVLLSLTDARADADIDDEPSGAGRPVATRGSDPPHGGLLGAAARVTGSASSAVRGALHLFAELPHLVDPAHVIDALALTQQTGQIANKLLMRSNPSTLLSGTPGIAKRVVWSAPRLLTDVKRVGGLAGATVNDVLVGAVSSAISSYLVDHGGDAVDLTTMVPVNLRAPGEPLPRTLGNRFALVLLELPTGRWAPLQRLSETKHRMDSIKHSPEAVLTFGLISAIGRTNPEIERHLVDFFSAKAIGVTTNVPGPAVARYVAGAPIAGLLAWVPGSGRQTLGVSILTYNGTVRVGFKTDEAIVVAPEKLVHAFDEAIDDFVRLAKAR